MGSDTLGYDLWDLVQHDEEGRLNETHITQPALLTASVAIWRVLQEQGLQVDYLAGHSLGEYSAQIAESIDALKELMDAGTQVFLTYPNNDAGGKRIVEALTTFAAEYNKVRLI